MEQAEYRCVLAVGERADGVGLAVVRSMWRRRAGCGPERFDQLAPAWPVPCWLSRLDWVQQVYLWLHTAEGRAACRAEPIAVDTAWRVAKVYADAADTTSGAGCRLSVAEVAVRAQCSPAVVHRTKRVLAAGAYMSRLFRGRHMTLLERLRAWEAGEKTRRLASVYALTMPRGRRHCVDSESPPPWRSAERAMARLETLSTSKTARPKAGEAATRPPGRARPGRVNPATPGRPRRRPRRRPRFDPRTLALVAELRLTVPWLRGGSVRRLAPAVHRYAVQDWTVGELVAAIDRQLALRERAVPKRLTRPEAYFAWLIGPVEPVDPDSGGGTAAAEHRDAERRRQAAERAPYTGAAAAAGEERRQAHAAAGAAAARAAIEAAAAARRAPA